MTLQPQTTAEMMSSYARELILLFGKDGIGKSCDLVSMAAFVEIMWPDAKVYVIDTEHKFKAALRYYKGTPPSNIICHVVNDSDMAASALDDILSKYKEGDWMLVESMARMWEHAQNTTYLQLTGKTKKQYLDTSKGTKWQAPDGRTIEKKGSPIPDPKLFWNIAKGIYDSFTNEMINRDDLNCLWTTTIAKQRKDDDQQFAKSVEREAVKVEFGIDSNINGQPSLPYQVQTLAMLERNAGVVTCTILRDIKVGWGTSFQVADRDAWASTFWQECRL